MHFIMITLKLLHTLSPTIWKISNSDKFFPNQEFQWLSMKTFIGIDLYQALTLSVWLDCMLESTRNTFISWGSFTESFYPDYFHLTTPLVFRIKCIVVLISVMNKNPGSQHSGAHFIMR